MAKHSGAKVGKAGKTLGSKSSTNFINWIDDLGRFYHLETPFFNQPVYIKDLAKQYGYALPSQVIIGEADLVDIVRNSKEVFAIPGNYHWVMANPILYKEPILNIMGKLRLWEFDK